MIIKVVALVTTDTIYDVGLTRWSIV